MTTLPGASIKSSMMVYAHQSCEIEHSVSALDAYFCFGKGGHHPTELFEMPRLPLVGGETGLGERFTNKIL